MVLSMCSDFFKDIFRTIDCKHPVIVLKDITKYDLECLLNYMYVGEVNVVRDKLASLIRSAECLSIRGLAVPDEEPNKGSHRSLGVKDSTGKDKVTEKRPNEDSPRLHSETKRRKSSNIEVGHSNPKFINVESESETDKVNSSKSTNNNSSSAASNSSASYLKNNNKSSKYANGLKTEFNEHSVAKIVSKFMFQVLPFKTLTIIIQKICFTI